MDNRYGVNDDNIHSQIPVSNCGKDQILSGPQGGQGPNIVSICNVGSLHPPARGTWLISFSHHAQHGIVAQFQRPRYRWFVSRPGEAGQI